MKRTSKALLLVAGLIFLACGVGRLILGQSIPALWVGSGLALALLIFAVVSDLPLFIEFFGMRTTKHGLNMGALILITVGGLAILNFLSVRYDKHWDLTSEGLNSLSEQSIKVAKDLKAPTEIVYLSNSSGGRNEGNDPKQSIEQLVAMYRDQNKLIELKTYSARKDPDVAKKFDFRDGSYGLYVSQGEHRQKVDSPSEESMTKALLRLSHVKSKVVYVVIGHGERDLESKQPEGLSGSGTDNPGLKEDLSDLFEVKTLALAQVGSVPADAAAVAILGPREQYLDSELSALRDYAKKGGRLLIALDPGEKQNLQLLTKSFGIEFDNDFVLDPRANVPGAGPVAALGVQFSPSSDITRAFPASSMAIFLLASSLNKAPGAPASFKLDELIKTGPQTVAVQSLAKDAKIVGQGPHTIAISSTGVLPLVSDDKKTSVADSLIAKVQAKSKDKTASKDVKKEADNKDKKDSPPETSNKEFSVVVFGDSDFFTNQLYRNNQNRNLIVNSFAALAKEDDMISIRPKSPKGTSLQLTREKIMMILFGFLLPVPILLFGSGGWFWWRRRTA